MGLFSRKGNTLLYQENQETVWIAPWGQNGLRIRSNLVGPAAGAARAAGRFFAGGSD